MRVASLFLILSASFGWSALARAETGVWDTGGDWDAAYDACAHARPLVPKPFPANAPGIPFRGTPIDVSLVAADGTVVPTSFAADVLALDGALTPGRGYVVRFDDACDKGLEVPFVAGDPVKLPTSIVLQIDPEVASGVSCAGDVREGAVSATVRLADGDGTLTPFLPIARVDLTIDGVRRAWDWGVVEGATSNLAWLTQHCPEAPKSHTIAAEVRIANGPTLTLPSFAVETSCAAVDASPCPPSAPGGWDAGAVSDDRAPDDAIATDDAASAEGAPPAEPSQGGVQCSATTTDVASSGGGLVALVLVGAALLRRRDARGAVR